MNTKLVLWIGIVFFGTIVVGVVWYLMSPSTVVTQQSPSTATLPISGSASFPVTSSGSDTEAPVSKMDLTLQDGTSVIVNDFIHNKITLPDIANAGWYMLAGNLGYCLSDQQKCQAASAADYTVSYNSAQQSFLITLAEPIGQARLSMEAFMIKTLGLTEQQLCNINYLVSVTRYVNTQYAGKNLGFSFCPGAVKLPQ